MFITPINKINSISEINKIGQTNSNKDLSAEQIPFKSLFTQALDEYKEAEAKVDNDIYELSIGESDDLHNLMINMKQAEMSFELFVQLRNKAVDAYKELMNTGM